MSSSPSGPSRWERLGAEVRLHTRIFDVLGVRFRHPVRETSREFVVVQAPEWVNVVALTPDERLVLVRQFRYGLDDFSLETPGGLIDTGEDPIVAGLRELREETGYAGVEAKMLGTVHPNPAFQSNRCHFVLVENVIATHPLEWDADEEIQLVTLPVEEALAMGRNGGITHSLVLNALMFLEPWWRARRGRGV
jgi:ADP-ribose pyrophosphatase